MQDQYNLDERILLQLRIIADEAKSNLRDELDKTENKPRDYQIATFRSRLSKYRELVVKQLDKGPIESLATIREKIDRVLADLNKQLAVPIAVVHTGGDAQTTDDWRISVFKIMDELEAWCESLVLKRN